MPSWEPSAATPRLLTQQPWEEEALGHHAAPTVLFRCNLYGWDLHGGDLP